MKYVFRILFLVLVTLLLVPSHTYAADLSTAMLRLDSVKANTALAGLVCATPTSTATEGKVQVLFPSDFTVLSSGWTTNTSGIPSGSTPWPGISYNSSGGTTATFNSGNINPGIRYCFNFSASGSSTGALGNKTGSIRTLTAGNSPIDSKQYGLTITNATNAVVTATVAASSSDFLATLVKTSPPENEFPPNQVISYNLSYETLLAYPSNVELVASWTQGTIEGSLTPSLDIVNYVGGSASDAYGGTPPVIDTINRTITWNINSFPGNTPANVTFDLITNSSFTGPQQVSFTVNGKLIGPGTESLTSSVTSYYQYPTSPITPTDAPGPTSTPGPSNSSSTTPTPVLSNLAFETISVNSVTSSTAQIFASLNMPANATLRFGISPQNLNKPILSNTNSTNHVFNLSQLQPNTQYYFAISASAGGKTITSDIYTFTTAQISDIPTVDTGSIIIESNNVLLVDPLTPQSSKNKTAIIPVHSIFQIKVKIDKKYPIKKIQIFLRPKNILGANTFTSLSVDVGNNSMMEPSGDSSYIGRLYSGNNPKNYDLYVKLYDDFGNIIEEKLIDIKVVKQISVGSKNKKPIEGAALTLYYFNETEKLYTLVSPQAIAIQNPSYSDHNGLFHITLPQGKYKAHVSAFGFNEKDVDFTISKNSLQDYPQIILEKNSLTVFSYISGTYTTLSNYINSLTLYLIPVLESNRFFEISVFTVLTLFILLSIFSFAKRFKFHLPSTHHFILLSHPLGRKRENSIRIKIINAESKAITDVEIFLEDNNHKILSSLKNQKNGMAYFLAPKEAAYISFIKQGYKEVGIPIDEAVNLQTMELSNHGNHIEEDAETLVATIFSLMFEVFITLSIAVELLLFFTWEPLKVLPFFILSLLNLWLWIRIKIDSRNYR